MNKIIERLEEIVENVPSKDSRGHSEEQKEEYYNTLPIYQYIKLYAVENGIKEEEKLFTIGERAVQKQLKIVTDYLGMENIGTHSFRKFFATEIYKNNDYNIVLEQQLLQHCSVAITQRYIEISSEMQERALQGHINLI